MFRSKSLSRVTRFGLKVSSGKNERTDTHTNIKNKSLENINTNNDTDNHLSTCRNEQIRRIRSENFSNGEKVSCKSNSLFNAIERTFKTKCRSASCSKLLENNEGFFSKIDKFDVDHKFLVTKYSDPLNINTVNSDKENIMKINLRTENLNKYSNVKQKLSEKSDSARVKSKPIGYKEDENKLNQSGINILYKKIYETTNKVYDFSQKLLKLPRNVQNKPVIRLNSKTSKIHIALDTPEDTGNQKIMNHNNEEINIQNLLKEHPSTNFKPMYNRQETIRKIMKNAEIYLNTQVEKKSEHNMPRQNTRKSLNVEAKDKQFPQVDSFIKLKNLCKAKDLLIKSKQAKSKLHKQNPLSKYYANLDSENMNNSSYVFPNKTFSDFNNIDNKGLTANEIKNDSLSFIEENNRAESHLDNVCRYYNENDLGSSKSIGINHSNDPMSSIDYTKYRSKKVFKHNVNLSFRSKQSESDDTGIDFLATNILQNQFLKLNSNILEKNTIEDSSKLPQLPRRSSVKLIHSAAFQEIDENLSDTWDRNKSNKSDKIANTSDIKLGITHSKNDTTKLSQTVNCEVSGKNTKQTIVPWNSEENYKKDSAFIFNGEKLIDQNKILNVSPSVFKFSRESVPWDRKNDYIPDKQSVLLFKGDKVLEQKVVESKVSDQSVKSNEAEVKVENKTNAWPWDYRKYYRPDRQFCLHMNGKEYNVNTIPADTSNEETKLKHMSDIDEQVKLEQTETLQSDALLNSTVENNTCKVFPYVWDQKINPKISVKFEIKDSFEKPSQSKTSAEDFIEYLHRRSNVSVDENLTSPYITKNETPTSSLDKKTNTFFNLEQTNETEQDKTSQIKMSENTKTNSEQGIPWVNPKLSSDQNIKRIEEIKNKIADSNTERNIKPVAKTTVRSNIHQDHTMFTVVQKQIKENSEVVNDGFISKIIKVNKNLSDEVTNCPPIEIVKPETLYAQGNIIQSTSIEKQSTELPISEEKIAFSQNINLSIKGDSLNPCTLECNNVKILASTDQTNEILKQSDKTGMRSLNESKVNNVTKHIQLFNKVYSTKATDKVATVTGFNVIETTINTEEAIKNFKTEGNITLESDNLKINCVGMKDDQLKKICTGMIDVVKKQNETLKKKFLDSRIVMSAHSKPKSNVLQDMITSYYKKKIGTEVKKEDPCTFEDINQQLEEAMHFPNDPNFVKVTPGDNKQMYDEQNATVNKCQGPGYDDIGCSIIVKDANTLKNHKISNMELDSGKKNTKSENMTSKELEVLKELETQRIHAERMAEFYEYEEKILGIHPPPQFNLKSLSRMNSNSLDQQDKNNANIKKTQPVNKMAQPVINESEQLNLDDTNVTIHSVENRPVSPINKPLGKETENITVAKTVSPPVLSEFRNQQNNKDTRDSNKIQEKLVTPKVNQPIASDIKPDESLNISTSSNEDVSLNRSEINSNASKDTSKSPSEYHTVLDKVQYYRIPPNDETHLRQKSRRTEETSVKDFIKIVLKESVVNNPPIENVELSSKEDLQKYMPNKISKFMLQSLFKTIFYDENDNKKLQVKNDEEAVIKQLISSVKETDDLIEESTSAPPLTVINDERFPMINVKKDCLRCYPTSNILLSDNFNDNVRCKHIPSVSKILNDTLPCETKRALHRWESEKLTTVGEFELNKFYRDQLTNDIQFHDCVRRHILGTPINMLIENVSKETKGCMFSLCDVFSKLKNITLLESSAVHSQLPYHGIVDCIANFKGEPVVIEWKQADRLKSGLELTSDAPVQMAAYVGAINHDVQYPFSIKSGLIVVAYTDGSPADIVTMSTAECEAYWKLWLERIQKYIISKSN